jgi:ribonuclease D
VPASSRSSSRTGSSPGALIASPQEFASLCDRLATADVIAFDTEFVSESSYRPLLCLLQFSANGENYAVDPFEAGDLSRWWEMMADPMRLVVIHGGREEIKFCLREGGRAPQNIIDVQIAEGLLSRGFPLGYAQLVQRATGGRVAGKHTRTDWSRRPLSPDQIAYALEDVEHLPTVWERQQQALDRLGRRDWVFSECRRFVDHLANEPPRGDWHRVGGSSRMSRREMALLEALYLWRDEEAERRDRPPRTVLRDDLLVEVAKIQPRTADELQHIRGFERRDYRRMSDDLLRVVRQVEELPESELPPKPKREESPPDTEALGKLLSIALANRCAELSVSTSLVGTTADLNDLIRWHVYDRHQGERPRLMQGWREIVCGDLLADLMDGKVTLRVTNPKSDHPLVFEDHRS